MSLLHLTPFLTAYLLVLAAALGLVLGSFCNAWAWRLVHGESIVHGRSHCAACDHPLSARDLVPLLSFVCLKGRCRYCGARIPLRYPLVEALCAACFLSVVLRYDLTLAALRFLILGCLLLTLSLVDWDTREIPNGLLAAAAAAALLRLPVEGLAGGADGLIGCCAVAVPLLLFVLLADRVTGKETMGGGDIKLIAVLGLHFGPWLTLFLLIVACVVGLLFGLVGRASKIPFGPAISLAAWVTLLTGPQVLQWYLSLFP